MHQKCILVLGMHRSGTSATSGALHLAGISMGKELLSGKADNEKGFFENTRILAFNDEKLLPYLGSHSVDIYLLPDKWWDDPRLEEYYTIAKEILLEEYKDIELFGCKEPRMCVLLPFWQKVLSELNIEIVSILPIRNPLEIAISLNKRDNMSIENTFMVWIKYVLSAEFHSRVNQRIFFLYDELLQKPLETLEQFAKKLNIVYPKKDEPFHKGLNSFLDKNLKHNTRSMAEIDRNLPEYLRKTANLLYEIAKNFGDGYAQKKEFDILRNEYEKKISFLSKLKYDGVIQLFIDDGSGFLIKNSIRYPVPNVSVPQEFTFSLKDKPNIQNIRLHPLNCPCVIEIEKIVLIDKKGSKINIQDNTRSNAHFEELKKYYFSEFGFDNMIYLENMSKDIWGNIDSVVVKILLSLDWRKLFKSYCRPCQAGSRPCQAGSRPCQSRSN